MNWTQQQQTLDETASMLEREGYVNKTASAAMYGKNANVVGMAFDCWTKLHQRAEWKSYDDEQMNAAFEQARQSYDTIEALARELYQQERSAKRLVAIGNETGVTQFDEDWAELQADYDQTVQDAAGRRGY